MIDDFWAEGDADYRAATENLQNNNVPTIGDDDIS